MTKSGVLQNRTASVVVGSILSVVSVQSWLGTNRPATLRNPVEFFGLAFSIFITASVATRSTFIWDRVVFGVATAALVLAAITAVFALPPSTYLAVITAKSLLWTISAVACVTILVRGLMTTHTRN